MDTKRGFGSAFPNPRLRFQTFFFFPSASIVTSHEFTVHETKNTIHALFMGPTTLFIHLKIILLQCFQFSISAKISCIQTNHKHLMHFSFPNSSCQLVFFIKLVVS